MDLLGPALLRLESGQTLELDLICMLPRVLYVQPFIYMQPGPGRASVQDDSVSPLASSHLDQDMRQGGWPGSLDEPVLHTWPSSIQCAAGSSHGDHPASLGRPLLEAALIKALPDQINTRLAW